MEIVINLRPEPKRLFDGYDVNHTMERAAAVARCWCENPFSHLFSWESFPSFSIAAASR